MTANTARVGVTLYSCVRSLRGLLLRLNTQLRFSGLFSSSVGERTLMNHFVVRSSDLSLILLFPRTGYSVLMLHY
jgi:hypothetical protein